MSISPDEVRHVARLARLDLTEEEAGETARDLARILAYVERLPSGEVEAGQGEARPVPLREDQAGEPLPPGRALEGAPEVRDGLFRVPPAIETP